MFVREEELKKSNWGRVPKESLRTAKWNLWKVGGWVLEEKHFVKSWRIYAKKKKCSRDINKKEETSEQSGELKIIFSI